MVTQMHQDFDALKLLRPSIEPFATSHMSEIITLIKMLIKGGFAYVLPQGDVVFSVSAFSCYGNLSKQNLEALRSKISDVTKKNPLDFMLWKSAKPDEPSWPSHTPALFF